MSRNLIDSNVEWIGKIPDNWSVIPLKTATTEINEKNNPIKFSNILSLTNTLGVVPYEEKGNQGNVSKEDLTQYKVAYKNTVIINSMNLKIGSVGLSDYDGCVSPVYYVLSANNNCDIRFINYLFQSEFQKYLGKYGQGILEIREKISMYDVLHSYIPFPSKKEQCIISDYLDKQCAKINTIIDDNNREIELLESYKENKIYETVNDSGDTTKKLKIKYLASVERGTFNHRPRNDERYYNGDYPFIQTGDVNKYSKYITTYSQTLNELGKSVSKEFKKGTLAITIAANIGEVAILDFDSYFPDSIIGINSTNNDYMYYILKSCKSSFLENSSISTQLNLNAEKIKNTIVNYEFNKGKQKKIVNHLDYLCEKIDEIIEYRKRIIEKLEEYKKSLIYEVVTGKKEV